jgi:hypothetical protein
MVSRPRQNGLDATASQSTAALVFFQHDLDLQTRPDVFSVATVHGDFPFRNNRFVDGSFGNTA